MIFTPYGGQPPLQAAAGPPGLRPLATPAEHARRSVDIPKAARARGTPVACSSARGDQAHRPLTINVRAVLEAELEPIDTLGLGRPCEQKLMVTDADNGGGHGATPTQA
jgi:hypothetical protein